VGVEAFSIDVFSLLFKIYLIYYFYLMVSCPLIDSFLILKICIDDL
jgi:hypothetical protein